MKRRRFIDALRRYGPALWLVPFLAFAAPAHADFYRLDGRFKCFEVETPTCAAGRVELHPPAAKHKRAAAPAPPAKLSIHHLLALAKPHPPKPAPHPVERKPAPVEAHRRPNHKVHGPLSAIAVAIRKRHMSATQIRLLRKLSDGGNGRAAALLAWCEYQGLGVARDPVAAYVLYGVAALAGIPRAKTNQDVIFNYVLTSDQRQTVLDIKNSLQASR